MKNRSTCTIYSFILLSIVAHALVFVLLDYLRPFGLNRPVMTVSVEFVEVIGGQSKAGSAGSVRPGFGNTGVPREKVEEKNAESHIQEAEGRQDYGKRAVIAYS